ncbi:hypothetical protein [Actinocorallia populi]|uniref:hypothetical protein n=1 Tax=Actinocorallia populi TaxID=2079200 RepID=UPI000D0964A1|nr:hypothetical protein [Actinocorallia populi]
MSAPRSLTIEIPDTPHLQDARRRIDVVRDATGRITTLAGTTAAGVVMIAPENFGPVLLGTAAVTGAGLLGLRFGQPSGHQKATTSVLYLMPGISLSALLVAERLITGVHWGEALALAAWTVGTWLLRPARTARRMVSPPPPPAAVVSADVVLQEVYDHPAAAWWAQRVATTGGAAPGTRLEAIEQTGEQTMQAVIRATLPGEPVPDISIKRLSALMDVPEDLIKVTPVPGRGAGVRRLSIGQTAEEASDDPAEIWAQQIAPAAMPGAVITGIRVGRPTTAAAEAERPSLVKNSDTTALV